MKLQNIISSLGFMAIFSAQASAPQAFDVFAGKWTGTLEYKDYQGNGRVKIPVKLNVKPSNVNTAIWDFVYDDFGKPVPSFETHTWNGTTYRVQTKGQTVIQEYTSRDFAVLIKNRIGKAVLIGSEIEIGAKVEVRRTLTLEKNKLITLKETRLRDGIFTFRNQSTYSRQP